MKFLLSFLITCISLSAFAQEQLTPVLFSKHQKQAEHKVSRGQTIFNFEIDTLGLPFIDDFSTNKIKTYNDDTSEVAYTIDLSYDYSFNGSFDSSYTTLNAGLISYILQWNSTEEKFDTNEQVPVEIIQFNNLSFPATAIDTFYYYNAFTIRVDSLGVSDTTFLIINDTSWVNDVNAFITIEDDNSLWMEENSLSVYVNNNYPINPPSLGVATFDALDEYGTLYSNASEFIFKSDELISKPIDLSSYSVNDSVVLSFFYQPQGIGEFPSPEDSLVLEFRTLDQAWTYKWSDFGKSYSSFLSENNTAFKQVFITIDDTTWLKKEFQFKFYNYASLAGNMEPSWASNADHWHIDYVVIDEKRDTNNLQVEDVAFVNAPKSSFVDFTQVPYLHYNNRNRDILKDSLYNLALNNSALSSEKNVAYDMQVSENSTNIFSSGGYAVNMAEDQFFNFFGELDGLNLNSAETDSTIFTITHSLATDANDLKTNDTLVYHQKLSQAYAYDDGSAEAGYGISSNGGKVALAFETIQDDYDTLQAIQIFFNQTLNNANIRNFKLSVWQGNGIEPSQLLYQSENISPEYSTVLNGFVTYTLDTTVLVGGEFYIGWEQSHEDLLNIGFDLNADLDNKLMYSIAATGGEWVNSSFSGALMMRPILGKSIATPANIKRLNASNNFILYPNPTSDILNIKGAGEFEFRVFNSVGQLISSGEVFEQTQIPVSNLDNGIYFFQIVSNESIQTHRFIVE